MRELSVAEQRYQAVLAVIGEGGTVTEVASRADEAQGEQAHPDHYAKQGKQGLPYEVGLARRLLRRCFNARNQCRHLSPLSRRGRIPLVTTDASQRSGMSTGRQLRRRLPRRTYPHHPERVTTAGTSGLLSD